MQDEWSELFKTEEELKIANAMLQNVSITIKDKSWGETTRKIPFSVFLNSTQFDCRRAKMAVGNILKRVPPNCRELKRMTPEQQEKRRKLLSADWYPTNTPAWEIYDPYVYPYNIFFKTTQFKTYYIRFSFGYSNASDNGRPATGWPVTGTDVRGYLPGTPFGVSMWGRPKSKLKKVILTAVYRARNAANTLATNTANSSTEFFSQTVVPKFKWSLRLWKGIKGLANQYTYLALVEWVTFDELVGLSSGYQFTLGVQNLSDATNDPFFFLNGFTPGTFPDHKGVRWTFDFPEGIELEQQDWVQLEIGQFVTNVVGVDSLKSLGAIAYFETSIGECNQNVMTFNPDYIVY